MIMESKELIALLQNIQKQQEILIARMPNPRLGFRTRGIPLEAVFCNSSNASTWYWLDRSTDENGIATPLKTELCARPEVSINSTSEEVFECRHPGIVAASLLIAGFPLIQLPKKFSRAEPRPLLLQGFYSKLSRVPRRFSINLKYSQ
jgi:hypothetical protein